MRFNCGFAFCFVATAMVAGCGTGDEDIGARAETIDNLVDRNDPRGAVLSAELNREMEIQLNLLTRLQLDGGHGFAFFEPMPGMVLMLEEGPRSEEANAMSAELEEMSISEIYERLSPGTEVPAALLEAEARQNEGGELGEAPEHLKFKVDGGENIAQSWSGLTAAQFTAQGGCPSGDYEFCLLNWANGAYAYAYSHRARFNLSPVQGSVLFELRVGGSWVGSWSALPGGYYYWTWHLGHSQSCYPIPLPPFVICNDVNNKATIRGDVTNASGNVFHYGGEFNN